MASLPPPPPKHPSLARHTSPSPSSSASLANSTASVGQPPSTLRTQKQCAAPELRVDPASPVSPSPGETVSNEGPSSVISGKSDDDTLGEDGYVSSSVSDVDEDWDDLAEEIALNTIPYSRDTAEENEVAMTGGLRWPLPRPQVTSDLRTADEMELQKALEELEDVELDEFLERVGKRVQEVKVAVSREDVSLPTIKEFKRADGTTDWLTFILAYLNASSAHYVPASLLVPPPSGHFSFRRARNHVERAYMICPPSLWEYILNGRLAKIYRWESKSTPGWCIIYFMLWATNLIPILPFAVLLFHLLRRYFNPPSTTELLARAKVRAERAREAAELSKSMSKRAGFSMARDSTVDLVSGILRGGKKKEQVSSLAKGLRRSAVLGSMAAGSITSSAKDGEVEARKDGALAKALAGASIAAGVGSPSSVGTERAKLSIPRSTPSTTLESSKDTGANYNREEAADRSSFDGDVSVYKLATEMARVFGPTAQEWMVMSVDLGEKIKNLFVHPDHPCVPKVILRLAGVCLFILICPTWLLYKGLMAYPGIEFFILWKLRELYPQYRRAMMPVWWILLDVPTDQDYALFILHKRAISRKPLRGSKSVKRATKNRDSGRDVGLSSALASQTGMLLLGVIPGSVEKEGHAPGLVSQEEVLGSYFAMLHSMPGSLVLSTTTLSFVPTRGFRTIGQVRSLRKSKSSTSDIEISDDDSVTTFSSSLSGRSILNGSLTGEKFIMKLRTEDVVGVKKEKGVLGFGEGLTITSRNGKIFKLYNMSKRDEVFNKIVGMTPAGR